MSRPDPSQSGFTLPEVIVGAVISSLVLAGVYHLWSTSNKQTLRLSRAAEARNQLALSTNMLKRSITMAGYGMYGVPGMVKSDQIGTDTLFIYSDSSASVTVLGNNYTHGTNFLHVDNLGLFATAAYVGISDSAHGEVRAVARIEGGNLILDNAFLNDYNLATAKVYPVTCEKYYSDQSSETLIRRVDNHTQTLRKQVHNFQVSFTDRNGASTEDLRKVRNVNFSLTGEYSPHAGEINSIVYSNTAIPRNLL